MTVYNQCTPTELAKGLTVWKWMSDWCYTIAAKYSVSPRKVCGIMAALSPNNSWSSNMSAVISILDGDDSRAGAYLRDTIKALWILAGCDPETVLAGPKTCAFYRLLLDGGNSWDVCIDGHMVNIMRGERRPLKGIHLTSPGFYYLAEIVREAARTIQIRPCDLQGIVWLKWRSSNGLKQLSIP